MDAEKAAAAKAPEKDGSGNQKTSEVQAPPEFVWEVPQSLEEAQAKLEQATVTESARALSLFQ